MQCSPRQIMALGCGEGLLGGGGGYSVSNKF